MRCIEIDLCFSHLENTFVDELGPSTTYSMPLNTPLSGRLISISFIISITDEGMNKMGNLQLYKSHHFFLMNEEFADDWENTERNEEEKITLLKYSSEVSFGFSSFSESKHIKHGWEDKGDGVGAITQRWTHPNIIHSNSDAYNKSKENDCVNYEEKPCFFRFILSYVSM